MRLGDISETLHVWGGVRAREFSMKSKSNFKASSWSFRSHASLSWAWSSTSAIVGEQVLFRTGGLRNITLSKLVAFLRGLEYISCIRALFLDAAAAVGEGDGGNER